MSVLKIKSAFIAHQHCAISYTVCDGHAAECRFDTIIAKSADGRAWALPNGRRVTNDDGFEDAIRTYDADCLLRRVRSVGYIHPECWSEQVNGLIKDNTNATSFHVKQASCSDRAQDRYVSHRNP